VFGQAIAVYRTLAWRDLTPNRRAHYIGALAPCPLRPGRADDVQRRPVPRRGWEWWTCGNGGFPDFHEALGSHFQSICWKWEKSRETAISRFPRPFSPQGRDAVSHRHKTLTPDEAPVMIRTANAARCEPWP